MKLKRTNVLITGGASGIGRIMARMALEKGASCVIIWDINQAGMFDGVRSRLIPILKPEYAARKIINAIERDVNFKGIPFGFHFIRLWQAILPTGVFDFLFGKVFGIYHTMDNFTGRKQSL